MDDFFPNRISHQIQKTKNHINDDEDDGGMDDFFPNRISHQIQKTKNHIDDDEDDDKNG
jgi:predicted component of type VI protein secretion system